MGRGRLRARADCRCETDTLLFASDGLPSALEAQRRAASRALDGWEPDELLATADADVMDYLIAEYSVECPVLQRDYAEQLPVSEEVRAGRGVFSGRPVEQRMTKLVLAVPFDGDEDVFKLRASNFSMNPPSGRRSAPSGGSTASQALRARVATMHSWSPGRGTPSGPRSSSSGSGRSASSPTPCCRRSLMPSSLE